MAITFEQIQKANEQIKTTAIQGKDYAEVNQRIKAFRMVFPDGFIRTELVSLEGGVAIFRAECGYYLEDSKEVILGTGTAYEKEGSSFINKTSFIENSETSAVGRALGMCGFGIDLSVASAEEVQNAMLNQLKDKYPEAKEEAKAEQKKATPKQIEVLMKVYTGANLEKLLSVNGIERIEDLPMTKASDLIAKLAKKEEQQNG